MYAIRNTQTGDFLAHDAMWHIEYSDKDRSPYVRSRRQYVEKRLKHMGRGVDVRNLEIVEVELRVK